MLGVGLFLLALLAWWVFGMWLLIRITTKERDLCGGDLGMFILVAWAWPICAPLIWADINQFKVFIKKRER